MISGKQYGLMVLMCFLGSCLPQKSYGDFVVINVLDKEFYDDCHIKGSVHIPFEQLLTEATSFSPNAEVVIYCSNYRCTTSHYAAKQLQKQGLKKVAVYEGGMAEWYQKGYPVEGAHQKAYLQKKIEKNEPSAEITMISAEELAKQMGYLAA